MIKNIIHLLLPLFHLIEKEGGTPYIVGGAVRDVLLQEKGYDVSFKDIDIEVHGISEDELMQVLSYHSSHLDVVGKSFGIILMMCPHLNSAFPQMEALDISLPRTERKVAEGHGGFDVTVNPYLGLTKAAARRDVTINSIYLHYKDGIKDPFNGVEDLHRGILRHTSDAFAEDPLRVLRLVQQAARFGLTLDPDTAYLCKTLKGEYHTISNDRIWGEWWKWATKSLKPSYGLQVLKDTGWIDFYPELKALEGVPQDPEWHPEGDVDLHTALVCDAAADISRRENLSAEDRGILVMAALCHDLGKAISTHLKENGRWGSAGHCQTGIEPTKSLFARMGYTFPKDNFGTVLGTILPLVECHLDYASYKDGVTPRQVNRLAQRVNIPLLALLVEADHSGRPPLPKRMPDSMKAILDIYWEKVNQVSRMVTGKDLIKAGYKPGPAFRAILEELYEAQLDGLFSSVEKGLEWLNNKEVPNA